MSGAIQKTVVDSLGEYLKANRGKVTSALNDSIDFERFAIVAMNTLRRTPALAQCSPASVVDAVNRCAELGLEPGGPLGHAYLVPYKSECQLILGYRGLVHLMFRSGGLKDIQAHVVCENDKFVGQFGTEPKVEHSISFGKRGKVIGAYAVLRFTNGGQYIEVMSLEELEATRASSRAKSGPWFEWTNEMYRKTVAKRASKWGPTGDGLTMAKAADYDDDRPDFIEGTSKPAQSAPELPSDIGAPKLDNTAKASAAIPDPDELAEIARREMEAK